MESLLFFSQGLPGLPGEAGPTGLDGQQVGKAKEEKNYSTFPYGKLTYSNHSIKSF